MFTRNAIQLATAIILLSVMLLIARGINPSGCFAYCLPDTGITLCYDSTGEIECPSPGEPFYGQDAQYTTCPLSYTDNGNGTVTDNNTGLMWQQDLQNISVTWQVAVTYCEDLDLGGHTDWWLPDIYDLLSIVHYGRSGPAVDTTYFTEIASGNYWSSSSRADDDEQAWYVAFNIGQNSYSGKTSSARVMCIRGEPRPASSCSDNGNGTVTDNVTDLMWQQQDIDSRMTWQDALEYCESRTLAGYNDWRLPNIRETASIVDWSTYDPAINTTCFLGTEVSWYYHSSSTYIPAPNNSWSVYFLLGGIQVLGKTTAYVRCVRGPGDCIDIDDDGYGDPASTVCPNPELDCNDLNKWIYPTNTNSYCDCEEPNPQGTEESKAAGNCEDGVDNDCDGLADCIGAGDPDCDCGGVYGAAANAQASTYEGNSLVASGSFNALALLVVPVGAVIALRILRRKR